MDLSDNALSIFQTLYSINGENVTETFRRVAKEFSKGNKEIEDEAFELLASNTWRPNTPVFFNAGTKNKVYSACYTVSLEDSMDSIYDTVNVIRKIFQHGAGVGIPVGNLREADAPIFEGDPNKIPIGRSSGAISFMKLFDTVGATTKSGGRTRRAAILCSMPVWHPNILEFIRCKEVDGSLSNMNISVSITDKFMQALEDGHPFTLHTPYDGSERGNMDPQVIWDEIVKMSHKTADPGVLFIDTINRYNVLRKRMLIEVTNPCGEQPLLPYLACNLSSINLAKFVVNGEFDFDRFYKVAKRVMRLMDNLIDVMDFPDDRFKINVLKYRPVGIGIMGLSDTLFMLGLPYDSPEGRKFASKMMCTLTTACIDESSEIAKECGPFEDWEFFKEDAIPIYRELTNNNEEVMAKVMKYGVRNCQHTTIAPTGTTAISADASYGMEPCFGLIFTKHLINGTVMKIINPVFKKYENEPWFTDDMIDRIIKNNGSLKGIRGVPKNIREVFVVAHDIKARDRIEMQAALQKHCSSGISSTVNLPKETTLDEISDIFKLAYKLGLKGITIYRDGSKKYQPITFTTLERQQIDIPTPAKPIKRPKKMPATSYQLSTGNGDILVEVATHNGMVMQIVMNMGKSGQILHTLLEALGRSMSIGLQHGVPLKAFVKTFEGINSDRPVWYRLDDNDKKPTQILSIPDGLAKLLKRYYIDKDDNAEEQQLSEYVTNERELCPRCGNYSVVLIEGCSVCTSCQETKCG